MSGVLFSLSTAFVFPPQRTENGLSVTNPRGRTLRRTCMRTSLSISSLRGSLFSTSSTSSCPASSPACWPYLSSTCLPEQVSTTDMFWHCDYTSLSRRGGYVRLLFDALSNVMTRGMCQIQTTSWGSVWSNERFIDLIWIQGKWPWPGVNFVNLWPCVARKSDVSLTQHVDSMETNQKNKKGAEC